VRPGKIPSYRLSFSGHHATRGAILPGVTSHPVPLPILRMTPPPSYSHLRLSCLVHLSRIKSPVSPPKVSLRILVSRDTCSRLRMLTGKRYKSQSIPPPMTNDRPRPPLEMAFQYSQACSPINSSVQLYFLLGILNRVLDNDVNPIIP